MNALFKPSSSEELRFEPINAADLGAISAIEQTVYSFPWSHGNFVDSVNSGYSLWKMVIPTTGQIAAYAVLMFAVDEVHLLNFSVAREWQGRGVGTVFMQQILALAQERHMRGVLLEVRPSNLAGQRLYRRAGFEQIGLRKGYYPAMNGREDALVLWHALQVNTSNAVMVSQ